MNRKGFRRGLALLAVLALAGCAGGGETGTGAGGQGPIPTPIPTPLPTPTPVPTPIVSIGAVTATAPGSASVNGVEYRVPSKVTVDGATLAAGALRVGMVATLKGTINADGLSGTADSVAVTKLVKGLASVVGASLTVLTQSIQVDETTSFAQGVAPDPAQLATALAALDKKYVEISGVVKKSGVIVATRVDVVAASSESRLIGLIGTFSIDEQTFTIGNLLVSFSSLGKPAASDFWSGSFVEVTGTLDDKGVLIASALEQAGFYEDNAERIELQDCISYFGDLYDFAIGRFAVQATASTVYTGGVATHMIEGTCVEVDGTLVDGVLNAAHISLQNKARVESNVATKDADTFTLDGLSGLTVVVNSATEYVKEGGNVTNFAAITIGHGVNVRGRYDPGTTTLLATRVDIGNGIGTDIVIRNYIDALTASPPTITLMGVVLDVAVDVMGNPHFTGGSAINKTEVKSLDDFYNVASPGNVVELEGKLNGTQITWNIVDLKD